MVETSTVEAALRRYCPPSLVREYEGLGDDGKKRLLDALISGQRDFLLQKLTDRLSQQATTATSAKRANGKCPLVRAFLEGGAEAGALHEEDVEYCRCLLASWGTNETNPTQKLLRYNETVAGQKERYRSRPKTGQTITNTVVVKTSSSTVRKNWSQLRKIGINELILFDTSFGCCLEGTIVGEAIQPMIGGTTLLKDKRGDILIVCFYNLLPDGISGVDAEPLLKDKFPIGASIRIAEPFLKIFKDGSRGIRVDDPSEIRVDCNNNTKKSKDSLEKAKQKGNEFVLKKQFDTALEIYWHALRSADFVPTVLSDRAQTYIHLEEWGHGLCDAAASLTIRPNSPKTWARYRLCLDKIAATTHTRRQTFQSLLDSISPHMSEFSTKATVNEERGQELKKAGNHAFQKKDYVEASRQYTRALLMAGGTVRALLSNCAFCALETGAYIDTLATAMASLRIAVEEKAIYRAATALALVGEHDLAAQVTHLFKEPSDSLRKFRGEAVKVRDLIASNAFLDGRNVMSSPSLLSNWVGPVETYMTDSMGRGIRATRDIACREVVLIERPLVSAQFTFEDADISIIMHTSEKGVEDTAAFRLRASLVHRSQHDGILSQIVNHLSDGSLKPNLLVPLSDLMLNLDQGCLLLPGHHEYLQGETRNLTSERIEKIATTNTCGHGKFLRERTIELFPALSMMNHASNPNCAFVPLQDDNLVVAVVGAARDIKQGEQLFMIYHEDEEKVKSQWGF